MHARSRLASRFRANWCLYGLLCHTCSTPSLGHYLRWLWRCRHRHRQSRPSHHPPRWCLYRLGRAFPAVRLFLATFLSSPPCLVRLTPGRTNLDRNSSSSASRRAEIRRLMTGISGAHPSPLTVSSSSWQPHKLSVNVSSIKQLEKNNSRSRRESNRPHDLIVI